MKKGFTLIELLVVVLIIGILSAIALPQYQTAIERSRATEALTLMNAAAGAIERYHAQHDTWPTTFSQLDVDVPCKTVANDGSCSEYGGKFFTLDFADNSSKMTVSATRDMDNHVYVLTTELTSNTDGSYSSVRRCTFTTNDTEAEDYCNAITGGHSGADKEF